jgi:hypothetical protein
MSVSSATPARRRMIVSQELVLVIALAAGRSGAGGKLGLRRCHDHPAHAELVGKHTEAR